MKNLKNPICLNPPKIEVDLWNSLRKNTKNIDEVVNIMMSINYNIERDLLLKLWDVGKLF